MSLFLLLNTKEDIFKSVVTKQLLVAIDFHLWKKNTMEVNGDQKTVCVQQKKAIQVWSNKRVIQWWPKKIKHNFWVNNPCNT